MKRSYTFVTTRQVVRCDIDGVSISLPVFVGVLKHPTERQLCELLARPEVARKYTCEALRKLPWQALRQFPHDWLRACLPASILPEPRRRAVEFMLSSRDA
jgi:hypothetical protein